MKLEKKEIAELGKLARVQLATSLPGVKPICLVGSQSNTGLTNLAPFSSITHLGSSPMLIGMVTRPASVERHTLNNILETGVWTLNHVHEEIMAQAHQCSARYEVSEFEATGLREVYVDGIEAPFVEEARVRYALELREVMDIKVNDTKLIIGEVIYIETYDAFLLPDGGLDLVQAGSLGSTALDTYFDINQCGKFDYAKPEKEPS
ncbi:flavin reductase [Akkermansiaceae bacterium]|nr:flavin reductase [Akkermansiaceae bacterium]